MCFSKGDKKCGCAMIAWVLVIIGAINWGLIGLGGLLGKDWNLVYLIFGWFPALENIIYILVGISGIMLIMGCKCKTCLGEKKEEGGAKPMEMNK